MFGNLTEKNIKDIIDKNGLVQSQNLIKYIEKNPKMLNEISLYQIANYANALRMKTKPFFMSANLYDAVLKRLPNLKGKELKVVDPASGIGGFLPILLEKYADKEKISIDFFDTDEETIEVGRALAKLFKLKRTWGVSFQKADFLNKRLFEQTDLLISDFPSSKSTNASLKLAYPQLVKDKNIQSLAPVFMLKALEIAKYIVAILPKNFLTTDEYSQVRELCAKHNIDYIVDLDNKGFTGLNSENTVIFLNNNEKLNLSNMTKVYSVKFEKRHEINQRFLTSKTYPNWILYRNSLFNSVARKMLFNTFEITKNAIPATVKDEYNSYWVIQPNNIQNNELVHTDDDVYVPGDAIKPNTNLAKTLPRKDMLLAYINSTELNVLRKPKDTAISEKMYLLSTINNEEVSDKQIEYLCSEEFKEFYDIATNYSNRSANIDSSTVFYLGLIQDHEVEENNQSETKSIDFEDQYLEDEE